MSSGRGAASRGSVRRFLHGADVRLFGERALHPSLIATYRLRTVAVGALITASLLVNLIVYQALSRNDALTTREFIVVLLLGVFALLGVVLTPWNRVLVTKWALRALYGWSVLDLVLVGTAIAFDNTASSVLFVMFPVLTVFFAIAYPRRAQAVLFAITVGVYLAALGVSDWHITGATLYIRIAALALVAVIASVLSGWLVAEMRDRARSRSSADRRAGMLDTVARAARRISSLDVSHVLGGALAGAMELGAHESEIWLLDGDPPVLKLQRRIAIDLTSTNETIARAMFEAARETGVTQLWEGTNDRTVACLLHREGEAAGLLLVRLGATSGSDSLVIECVELLAAQVSAGLDVARNVAERRGLEERLAHWAFHDSLTDLPNRVLFADRLELALARSARDGSSVAVLFLDLDGFKDINDSLGHAVGDQLLQSVAHRLQSSLRPNDTLARYGGDEFVVLVEQVDSPEFVKLVAQRILDALNRPLRVGNRQLSVQTSIGIAIVAAEPGADSDVVRRADMAMYQAKAAGGSRYVIAD